ncbi:MAG: LysR family transcriptional regulator [Pseudomonadota bacterium]
MDLRQLRHFVAVYERGNLSRAAEDINISQPALTRSIKTLEDELGVELLTRHARGTSGTEAGERFYHHAKSILAECSRARSDAALPDGELAGEVAIGIGALFASHIIDDTLASFCDRFPKVSVTVLQGFFEELVTLLELGQIELAFINFPLIDPPENIIFEPLYEVRASVLVAADHPLAAANDTPSLQALSEARWVIVNQPHSMEVFDALFVADGIAAPHTAVNTNSLTLIRSLITTSGFVGLIPDHLLKAELADQKVKRLNVPSTPIVRPAGLLRRRDGFHRAVADELAEAIRAECLSLRGPETS